MDFSFESGARVSIQQEQLHNEIAHYSTCQKQAQEKTDFSYRAFAKSEGAESSPRLFTIGYEGISVDEYMNYLLQNEVKVLVDVRNKPFSRKPGFSKNQLANHCSNLQIGYVHFPEAGIKPEERKVLKTQADYKQLFDNYVANTLPQIKSTQMQILELLKEHKRIALTCFETDVTMCHRKYLSEALAGLAGFCGEVVHIQTKAGGKQINLL